MNLAEPKIKPWSMPVWMEPYRDMIVNTGGNSIEDLMNDRTDSRVNLPLVILSAAVRSQVLLLQILHERRLLR